MGAIREASYNEGAAILLDDSDDADEGDALIPADQQVGGHNRRDSRASRTSRASRSSRLSATARRNFGGASDPVGLTPVNAPAKARRGSNEVSGRTGNSRSRSTARTPPRHGRMSMAKPGDFGSDHESDHGGEGEEGYFDFDEALEGTRSRAERGRGTESRPLSRSSSPLDSRSELSYRRGPAGRRGSMATTTRFAEDSSGDEGGDVARGLVGTGGVGMLGTRGGNGMIPGHSQGGGGMIGMEVDPAEELLPEDLEVPLDKDGLEIRDWTEALRVS